MPTKINDKNRKRKQSELDDRTSKLKRKASDSKVIMEFSSDSDAIEHAQLLGSVTGHIKKLPLEKDGEPETCKKTSEVDGIDKQTAGVDKQMAADYLILWDTNRRKWSFKKKTQYWLLQNMYEKQKVY